MKLNHSLVILIFCNLVLGGMLLYLRSVENRLNLVCTGIIFDHNQQIVSECQILRDLSKKTSTLTQKASPLCDLIFNLKLPIDYTSMLEYMNKFNEEVNGLGFKANCQSAGHKGLVLYYIDDFMIKYKLKEQEWKVPEMRMVIERISKNDDSIYVKITPLFLPPELVEFSINGECVGNKNPHCLEDNPSIDPEVIIHKLLHTEIYRRKLNE